ncbi:hypothetical protein KR026_004927, partial [Drosophila bipectinata]
KFEFKNVECTALDKDFMGFDECFLKSANRSFKYMSFRTKFYQFPVDDVTVCTNLLYNSLFRSNITQLYLFKIRVEVLKRLNGYKPFLFNFTVDACKFLKGQKKTSVTQFFYDLFAPYSNMLHKCPYDHDVFVKKLPISHLDHMLSNVLPFPEGVYCVHSVYYSHGIPRMDLKVYVQIQ